MAEQKIEVVDLPEEHQEKHEKKEDKEHHKVHHEKHHVKVEIKNQKINPWQIASGILALLLVIVTILLLVQLSEPDISSIEKTSESDQLMLLASTECTESCRAIEPVMKEMAEKANMQYSKAGFFQPVPVPIYMLKFNDTVYISTVEDANMLTLDLCTITQKKSICADSERAQAELEKQAKLEQEKTLKNIPKTEKPAVELFVMSHCPFGTQMEKATLPAAKLLGKNIDFNVRFVYYAMHGEKEVMEQLQQYCIQKEQRSKYLTYLECFLNASDSQGCLDAAKIDKEKLSNCMKTADEEFEISKNLNNQSMWLNGRYPLFNTDKFSNEKYGVRGSPTLIINGNSVSVSRDPQSILNAICKAFTAPPEACKEQLSTEQASPGFGYKTGSASTDAQCG